MLLTNIPRHPFKIRFVCQNAGSNPFSWSNGLFDIFLSAPSKTNSKMAKSPDFSGLFSVDIYFIKIDGGSGWICFSAEKPSRLQQSTGLLPSAAPSNPPALMPIPKAKGILTDAFCFCPYGIIATKGKTRIESGFSGTQVCFSLFSQRNSPENSALWKERCSIYDKSVAMR